MDYRKVASIEGLNTKAISFCLARFFFALAYWVVLAYLPIILKDYGLRDDQIGILIGTYSLGTLLPMLPLGILLDFLSSKRLFFLSLILFFAYITGLFYLRKFLFLFIIIFLGGLAAGGFIILLPASFFKYVGESKRAIAIFQAAGYLGFGLGPFLGGIFLRFTSTNYFFAFIFLSAFFLAIILFFLPDIEPIPIIFKSYFADLKNPAIWPLIITLFVIGMHFGAERTALVLFLKENIKVSPFYIGLFFSIIGLWMAVISPIMARLKTKNFSLLALSLAWSGIFQFFTGFTWNFPAFLLTRILHTAGDSLYLLEINFIIVSLFPGERIGGHSGFLFTLRSISVFLGASLTGLINQHLGYAWAFYISGSLSLIWASILGGLFSKRFVLLNHKRPLC
ncbi:MAG TPA: MFS transporter [Candidatus Desulfofervidus auxilii]|uniref:MFS transporter n=1 Tax=Desulfofervidus auxilii TaxID=1621989 RepID=A0A7V0IAF9_DESA2|nr:MFS transporter [Candidatus Desulfofervidus auxilii]